MNLRKVTITDQTWPKSCSKFALARTRERTSDHGVDMLKLIYKAIVIDKSENAPEIVLCIFSYTTVQLH